MMVLSLIDISSLVYGEQTVVSSSIGTQTIVGLSGEPEVSVQYVIPPILVHTTMAMSLSITDDSQVYW